MAQILAAIDFSDATDGILAAAARLGGALRSPVCLLHVAAPDPDFLGYQTGPQVVRDQVARHWHEEHRQLQAFAEKLKAGGLEATALLIQGATAEKIIEEATRVGAEMIIVGSHGHGALRHVLLGSVSEAIVRHAACPVLVVPSPRK
jgi:nucleotide-binding universal stress UspA family protein